MIINLETRNFHSETKIFIDLKYELKVGNITIHLDTKLLTSKYETSWECSQVELRSYVSNYDMSSKHSDSRV